MADRQETLHFLDYWQVVRSRKEIVIAVALLVVLTGIIITFAMPKVYMASSVIAVREEAPDVPVFSREMVRFDPFFLRTQYEIIRSKPILEEVMAKLNLNEKLGAAYGYLEALGEKSIERTLKILSRSMKVQQYRDTNLIEIQIYLSEPKGSAPRDAAEVANMVASVYRGQSMLRSRTETDRALNALHDSLEEQQKRVDDARAKVDAIRQKYKITLVSSSMGTDSVIEKMSLTRLEDARLKVRMELEDKRARYEKIKTLSPKDVLDAAPYVVGDPALAALVAEKRKAEVELSRLLKASLGPKHPDVMKTEAAVEEIDTKINDALNGLRTGLLAEYEAAQAKVKAVEEMLEELKASERNAETSGYREFEKASEEMDHAQKILNTLEARYLEEKIEQRIPRTTVEVIEPAKPPDENDYVSPNFALNVLLSILLGLASGIGLAYFVEYLDTSVKTIEDIENYLRLPVLGVIPQKVRPLIEEGAQTAHAEAYRVLRANIQFSKRVKDGKVFCFTSGSVGEGKSLTLFNLAYVCTQMGDKVLVVDSDLHRPRQHKILGMNNSIGLANVLTGDKPAEEAIRETKVPNLMFMASGRLSSGVHGLLDSGRIRELVDAFKKQYDLILFDAPPIIGVSDATLLVREMDGVLLVVQHRKYPRAISNRAKEMIENVGANLVGVVLNNINISRDYSYYYHHYYYYPYAKAMAKKPA